MDCRMLRRAVGGQQRGTAWVSMANKAGGGKKGEGQNLGFTTHPRGAPRSMGSVAARTISKEGSGHGVNYHCVIPRQIELIKLWPD